MHTFEDTLSAFQEGIRDIDNLRRLRQRVLAEHGSHLAALVQPAAVRPVPGYAQRDTIENALVHLAMLDAFNDHPSIQEDATGAHMYALYARMADHGIPLFLVGDDLLQAAGLSRVPDDLLMEDVRLAFPGMAFLLPEPSAPRTPDGTPYQAIGIARITPGPVHSPSAPGIERFEISNQDGTSDDLLIVGAWSAMAAPFYAVCRPWRGTVGDLVEQASKGFCTDFTYSTGALPLATDDREFTQQILSLGITLALFSAKGSDSLATEPRFLKRARMGSGRTKVDLFEPRWLGRDYRLPRPSGASTAPGTHARPRAHWRRGHFRRVACGEGRTHRLVHWIEPTLVAG